MTNTEKLCQFIQASPSCFHAVEEIKKQLHENGFEELSENKKWILNKNESYYVTRNNSSIIAFKIGNELEDYGFKMSASHSDSPTFKIKQKAELESGKNYLRLNVEGYGGMIHSTWLDRPLSVAGRCYIKDGNQVKMKLFNVDRDTLLIPNMAIHMNREINNGFKYNPQIDLCPLFEGKAFETEDFKKMIAESCQVESDQIISMDAYLYCRTPYTIWGGKKEFVSSPKLDDLQCAYTTLQGFIQGNCTKSINVYCCFDNEEVGSTTRQGANSNFLETTLKRINACLGKDEEDYLCALANSFMISADNAHAVHPNHPEKTDAKNCTYMNSGIVVKSNANQSYTTDSLSCSLFVQICEKAKVPVQFFANRSDERGGGTLGNISGSHVSVSTVDIGLAQLAMHSSYETAGSEDTDYMIKAMKAYYDAEIVKTDSCFELK